MYQSLYRKYRPSNFDEVVGQEVPVKILKNAIKNNRIAHAYIFAGIRGTGKTSIAKIFAKTVNCLDPVEMKPCGKCVVCTQSNNTDIVEIDAASNNGVDEIREIFYQNGVEIRHDIKNKKGKTIKEEITHYKMLYRSTGKAKKGSCMFIWINTHIQKIFCFFV